METTQHLFSNVKLIMAGDVLHYYKYSKPIQYGSDDNIKRREDDGRGNMEEISGGGELGECEENLAGEAKPRNDRNVYRCRKAVKLLLESNAFQYPAELAAHQPVFITYTFAENICRLAESNPIFTTYTKRLNYNVFGEKRAQLKYLVVPEFQKSGRVHYHGVYFNLPFVPRVYDFISDVWGQGFTNVKSVSNVQHLTNYVSKYITKEVRDERTAGRKKYFCARGLFQPIVEREQHVVESLLSLATAPPDYSGSYTNDELQLTTDYQCFRFKQPMRQQFLTTRQLARWSRCRITYSSGLYSFS